MDDLISRQAAINVASAADYAGMSVEDVTKVTDEVVKAIKALPSTQPEIIRCKDCRWWDKYDDYDKGYCMAAKHGYWSGHWDISIRRTYKGDFYCADAEPKMEETNE